MSGPNLLGPDFAPPTTRPPFAIINEPPIMGGCGFWARGFFHNSDALARFPSVIVVRGAVILKLLGPWLPVRAPPLTTPPAKKPKARPGKPAHGFRWCELCARSFVGRSILIAQWARSSAVTSGGRAAALAGAAEHYVTVRRGGRLLSGTNGAGAL